MSWDPFSFFKARKRAERDEEIRQLRGGLAVAVVKNDRRANELREMLAGAHRLREGHDRETDR